MTLELLATQGRTKPATTMAASVASRIYEIRKKAIKESLIHSLSEEHRLEFVARVHGIEFINDSKASNVNATWFALEKMTRQTVWIVGGQDKGNDYSSLNELVQKKVKRIICLGKNNEHIVKHFQPMISTEIFETTNAKMAVELAYKSATTGDAVLLSPACPSFDLYENYEDRGRQFKLAINEL